MIRNAHIVNVRTGELDENTDVLVVDGTIQEIGPSLNGSGDFDELDGSGLYLMPGLIDAHVHLTASSADLAKLRSLSKSYIDAHTAQIMKGMLARGFTTVRDAGGADYGLAAAQQEPGLLPGPRVLFCGQAISASGGHGDFRGPGDSTAERCGCPAGIGRIADGVDQVRHAARDELRKGAHHLKVMAGGGVSSETDRIDSTQYSMEELRAIVDEAHAANRYVMAHAYTPRAIKRALDAGVRSIEHGNLIDDSTIDLMIAKDAYLVPTLVTHWALKTEGRELGLPGSSIEKLDMVIQAGRESYARAAAAGVKIAFGSDLLGAMHRHQSQEFALRAESRPLLEVIQSATIVAAELMDAGSRLGAIEVGRTADMLLLDRDPLSSATVLSNPELYLRYVIQEGRLVSSSRSVLSGA